MIDNTALLTTKSFSFTDLRLLKQKMLNWAHRFNIFLFLDNQQYNFAPQRYECLLAAGVRSEVVGELHALNHFFKNGHWCFGHLAYDLKTELHNLPTNKPDGVQFPHFYFFEPEIVVAIVNNEATITAPDPETIWDQINAQPQNIFKNAHSVELQPRLSREAYLHTIRQLQQHILRGDCYEINFCQEFFAEGASINPVQLFLELSIHTPAPFAALYRLNDRYLISASPERFLTRMGSKLIAQPMKGTARRNLQDPSLDDAAKQTLYNSLKERSENVMVVDLVRNDLAQVCAGASVKVEELFGIYSFPQVHQMVSTISGMQRPEISFKELLQANFPMGSMTGAPKLRVMQLIDQYETVARGIFSGSVGYVTPDGDFDFNVVIRSVMYDATTGYVSCQVGSGITFYSDAEAEWEECLLKAAAIRKVLGELSDI